MTYDEIIAQMTAAIVGIRKAIYGVEVREHIAVAMENVLEVGRQAIAAAQNASSSETNAKASENAAAKSASVASKSADAAKASASNAVANAAYVSRNAEAAKTSAETAKNEADRAAAIASTDKTLSFDGAAADAKAVGDKLLGSEGTYLGTWTMRVPGTSSSWTSVNDSSGYIYAYFLHVPGMNSSVRCYVQPCAEDANAAETCGLADMCRTTHNCIIFLVKNLPTANIMVKISCFGRAQITLTSIETEPKSIMLNAQNFNLALNSQWQLAAYIMPSYSKPTEIAWSAEPEGIVNVENGLITPLKEGAATITASIGSVSSSCTVNIGAAVEFISTTKNRKVWSYGTSTTAVNLPLTAKKDGLKLNSIRFAFQGYLPGTMTISITAIKIREKVDSNGNVVGTVITELIPVQPINVNYVRGYNEIYVACGNFEMEKGLMYQLHISAANKFYGPHVEPDNIAENDYIDISTGADILSKDTALLFDGLIYVSDGE